MKLNLNDCRRLKTFYVTLVCLMIFGFTQAQSQKITGQVTSEGLPLPGASVVVKGTTNGATTDFDGNYSIDAKKGDILVFTYIGFVKKEVKVESSNKIDVVLSDDVAKLDEIVIIGYGSAKRKDLTGSVVSLKAEDLDKLKPVSFEGTLVAKAAGVQVTTSQGGPGASSKIKIRGGTSINANSDPLYVIDGFAIDGTAQNDGLGLGNSSSSPLAAIDPANIQSIEVLKDASATAIYGSRGANGVILITTKRGKKGRANLNLDMWTSFATLTNKIDLYHHNNS